MNRISLKDLLNAHWNTSENLSAMSSAEMLEVIRQKEQKLRRFFPAWLVRRLDAGFARSNTVHPETGHALYAIAQASRATCIFETGTYWGYSTAYLAAALQRSDTNSKVYTFDIYPHAGKHIPRSLRSKIELYRGRPSVETMPDVLKRVVPNIFFQDSRHDYEGVIQELNVVAPYLKHGAVVLFHDFIEPNVRQAALDGLKDYTFYVLDIQDPQQLGVAIKTA